ncbi:MULTISPECIES: hypothetical protein [Xanthomonas]|uniref:hypothetical protein n=1 Tax=Xanthomonas TaxID=338 RepID=UPI0011E751CD|nr:MULTISPECIES: hypothetical protein [Xanthomonas]MDQ7758172.1 hypothetical protein [Xanthomonas sontii]UYK71861.1 hypothetical protein NG828_16845 [Xanthomonas sacchari]
MSEQSWLAYAGSIAGMVGGVTGVIGAVVAILAFRRTGEIKALDLRVELRRMESTLRSDIQGLVPLLERAKKSHTRLAAAQGCYRSGAVVHWLSEWDIDFAESNQLVAGASVLDLDCSKFSQKDLETRLVTVYKLQRQVAELSDKYRTCLATDDADRQQLRADQRLITQARLDGKL